jgi:phosphatidylglycerol:prolipoprotein diacylglycerol transferase
MDGIPYIDIPQSFGPIKTFGLFLVAGLAFGSWMARKYCQRNDLDEETMRWLGVRLIVWGLIGAVGLNIVFYDWSRFLRDPWDVIKALGISSYGAIVASAIAFFYYTGKKGLDRRRWADATAWGVSGGWLFGRLGCAVAHDHIGALTDSPFGVNIPPDRPPFRAEQVVRAHDLGLYEFLLWIPLLLLVVGLERWKGRRPGTLLGALAVTYSIPRFLFEFLRLDDTDPRLGGLTFAQWASIAAFVIGLWLLVSKPRPAPVEA